MRALLAAALVLLVTPAGVARAACDHADFQTEIAGADHCLRMARFGTPHPASLVVWLHADLPGDGPADYHIPLARESAERFAAQRVMAVALLRPGYPDRSGRRSGGSHLGRSDHYTTEAIDEVAGAIARLRARFAPATVLVVGHGGGAAVAAVMLGRHPGAADAAVLIDCPCDLAQWRLGRRYWGRSEDPMRWIGAVPRGTRVVALSGARDAFTPATLAQDYVAALRAREVDARFEALGPADSAGAPRDAAVVRAIRLLIGR